MANRLSRLIRKVEAERRTKINATKRPWLNLVRMCASPCNLHGITCYTTDHSSYSKQESRKIVAKRALVLGALELVIFGIVALCVAGPSKHSPLLLHPALVWMWRFSWVFCLVWWASLTGWFYTEAGDWTHHANQLAGERARLQAITLGTLLATELKEQIEAARRCLLEGDAGLLIWQKRVEERLKSLPATEVATLPPPEGDHPYHTAARLTVVQTAADQADLYAIAGAYRGLNFRIAEIITAYNALAEILGQSIDRRDELGRSKGTDFDPRKDMARITQEVNGKLDQIFADLKDLQREVSALNGRAEQALSNSVVKNITKAIAGVRIGHDAPAETADVAAPSGTSAQERRTGR